jgi:DNA-binding transcriptional LysR family regulator
LRDTFQDPLLVKGKYGMVLTARAIDIYPPLQRILREINHIVTVPAIHPADMQGEIVIATRDYELATILPSVISEITTKAPHLKLSIISQKGDDLSLLENENVDFVLSGTNKTSANLHRYTLLADSFVCLVAKNHPVIKTGLDLTTYLNMKHCLISINHLVLGYVDTLLSTMNLKRNIAVRIPHFLAVSHVIQHTDLIVTLPRGLGELLAKNEKIMLLQPPLDIPDFPIHLYWHTRNQSHSIHQWVRKIIKKSRAGKP